MGDRIDPSRFRGRTINPAIDTSWLASVSDDDIRELAQKLHAYATAIEGMSAPQLGPIGPIVDDDPAWTACLDYLRACILHPPMQLFSTAHVGPDEGRHHTVIGMPPPIPLSTEASVTAPRTCAGCRFWGGADEQYISCCTKHGHWPSFSDTCDAWEGR